MSAYKTILVFSHIQSQIFHNVDLIYENLLLKGSFPTVYLWFTKESGLIT